jgi:hypothetical protein
VHLVLWQLKAVGGRHVAIADEDGIAASRRVQIDMRCTDKTSGDEHWLCANGDL